MNPREISNALIRRRPAPRMGLFDQPWPETVARWTEEGHLKVPGTEGAVESDCDPVLHFGFDMAYVGGFFDSMPLRGVFEVLEETEEWRKVRTGAGGVIKVWKAKSGTPEHVSFTMTSPEIWARDYRPHLLSPDGARLQAEPTRAELEKRRRQGLWTFFGHLGIWETMRQTMGDFCMMESLALEPDWIHDFNRVYTDFYKTHFQLLIEGAGKPDGIWLFDDLGYRNGLFCSPDMLNELFLPYYKDIVGFFHAMDLPVVLHSCGNVTAALPMIVEAGFDALNPMEAKAGCDLLGFAETYGDRLAFIGGFDARILESGDREAIRRETVRIVEGMKSRGARYFFGSDHSLSPLVRYEDFLYAVEVYREHRDY